MTQPPPSRKGGTESSTPPPGPEGTAHPIPPTSHQRIPAPPSSRPPSSSDAPPALDPIVLKGIAGSPGVAVGPAVVLDDVRAGYARRHIHSYQVVEEIERVHHAVTAAKQSLIDVAARLTTTGPGRDNAPILEAYLLMLSDPMLHEIVERKIRDERKNAEWAVAGASEEIAKLFGPEDPGGGDSYILERRHDIKFVSDRLMRALAGEAHTAIPRLEQPMIVIARDLSPADTAGMVREPAVAFVTEVGTRTSHTSIMARALEIPAVVGVADALQAVRTGDIVIVDGLRGEMTVHPTEAMVLDARDRAARHLAFARGLLSARDRPCVTADGEAISLKANVELPAEAILALDHGANGIGLYRTEFLYIDRTTQPDEQEQYELYRAVIEAVAPRPVVLRTFDIGGDKFASTFQLPAEMNPALGLRAVRLALERPEVFLTQLRAMVRASAHGDLRIMIPMIASVYEIRAVRKLLARAIREVAERGQPHAAKIPLGMMVEVPAAAVMADVFAREVEFFSIGTNDLIQYTLAIDRASRTLARLASPFDPSILRLIHGVARAADENRIGVSLCGAMASDPLAAAILVGLGLRDLSMEAAAIPEIKEALRRVTITECRATAEAALASDSADAVEELVARAFAPRFYDLLTGSGADTMHGGSIPPPPIA
ncbi:MAG: phosphoenolpyruvate--protein phosphotransferase [Polyangiaceae bacterium]